jgi:iron complex transport system ATP-binding protein
LSAIYAIPTKQLAKELGILPQGPSAPEGITVRELVSQGRYPYQDWFQQWGHADENAQQKALILTSLTSLADRAVDTLSGGNASVRGLPWRWRRRRTSHELNHAAHYADHLVTLYEGEIVAQGHPREVITQELVRDAFQVESKIVTHPVTGLPLCLPLKRNIRGMIQS